MPKKSLLPRTASKGDVNLETKPDLTLFKTCFIHSVQSPLHVHVCQFWKLTSPQSCMVDPSATQSRSCAGQNTAWGKWWKPQHHLS